MFDSWSPNTIAGINLIFSVASTVFMAILTFLGLQFIASPKIRIDMFVNGIKRRQLFTEEKAIITFRLKNVGHFYAKPAASYIRLFINFDSNFEVFVARYGSVLEHETSDVHLGKNNSKYLYITTPEGGIQLFYGEGTEDVEVDVQAPKYPSAYKIWVPALCDSGGLGRHEFKISVVENPLSR